MRTYKVGVSGWAEVLVDAKNEEEAEELVRDETPGIAGELYDMEIQDVTEATEEEIKEEAEYGQHLPGLKDYEMAAIRLAIDLAIEDVAEQIQLESENEDTQAKQRTLSTLQQLKTKL